MIIDGTRTYQFLDDTHLNPKQVKETQRTYARQEAAETYSDVEWRSSSINNVYRVVLNSLRDHILRLPENSTVLIGGAGSFRDVLTFLLLSKKIEVFAYDLSQALVSLGVTRLVEDPETTWKLIELMLNDDVIGSFENGHIRSTAEQVRIINKLRGSNSQLSQGVKVDYDYFVRSVINKPAKAGRGHASGAAADVTSERRFTHLRANHDEVDTLFPYIPGFNIILAIATLDHLERDPAFTYMVEAVKRLSPGGVFHFDLRVDPYPAEVQNGQVRLGRVFQDASLGDPRWMQTYSADEIRFLVDSLRRQFPNPQYDIKVVAENIPGSHPDKPRFSHIRVTRNY